MITLNMALVGTVLVMVLALVFGVWMARDRRVDLGIRPLLDAGQTIPPFVYLIPVLALFGPSRFTAIVAGVVYAAPAAIKLVADGVKGVSPTTIEAGRSTGQTTWQEITKVQLPMAKGSLVLATNQGLLYVLAMVVIGGLVGAGALGYDVVLGISRSEEWGKGAAAGLTIVLLGVMLDRITRAAADVRRDDGPGPRRAFNIRLPIGPPRLRPPRFRDHTLGEEEQHDENCQESSGPPGRPRHPRHAGALRLRRRRVDRRGDRGQRVAGRGGGGRLRRAQHGGQPVGRLPGQRLRRRHGRRRTSSAARSTTRTSRRTSPGRASAPARSTW